MLGRAYDTPRSHILGAPCRCHQPGKPFWCGAASRCMLQRTMLASSHRPPGAGMSKTSLDKSKIKFLLLEGIHPSAVEVLRAAGYSQIESISGALPEAELQARIADVHFLGIRSRTQLGAGVFAAAQKLVAVGCFCIGTNQVDP